MKKFITTVAAVALVAVSVFAQDGAKDIYAKYSKVKNATSVYVSPAMFNLIGNLDLEAITDGDAEDFLPLVRSLRGLYIIECEDGKAGKELFSDALKYAHSANMELQMEVNDDGDHVKLYSEAAGDVISNFLFLVETPEDDEYVMINILGEITRDELSAYIAKASSDSN